MNYEITDVAYRELDRAICYFKSIEKEEDFLDDLMHQIKRIIKMPKAFQIRYKNVRIVSLNNFDYSVHYSVYDNTIFVLRILNQSQNF